MVRRLFPRLHWHVEIWVIFGWHGASFPERPPVISDTLTTAGRCLIRGGFGPDRWHWRCFGAGSDAQASPLSQQNTPLSAEVSQSMCCVVCCVLCGCVWLCVVVWCCCVVLLCGVVVCCCCVVLLCGVVVWCCVCRVRCVCRSYVSFLISHF